MGRLRDRRLSGGIIRGGAALVLLCALAVGLPVASRAQGVDSGKEINQLLSISAQPSGEQLSVHIETREPVGYRYTVYDSHDPIRVVIDFPGMDVSAISGPVKVEQSPVEEIRVSSFDLSSGRLGRVEILLKSQVSYNVSLSGSDFRISFPVGVEATSESAPEKEVTVESSASEQAPVNIAEKPSAQPAAEVSPPRASSAAASSASAKMVEAVTVQGNSATMRSDGRVERFQHFTLGAPPRMVVDIYGVKPAFKEREFKGSHGFSRVRVGAYPDKTRFVFDADSAGVPKYGVTAEGDALVVTWGEDAVGESSASARAVKGEPVSIDGVDFSVEDGKSVLLVSLSGSAEVIEPSVEGDIVRFGVKNARLSRALRRTIDTSAFPSSVRMVTPYTVQAGATQDVRFAAELKGPVAFSLEKVAGGLKLMVENGPYAEVAAHDSLARLEVPAATATVGAESPAASAPEGAQAVSETPTVSRVPETGKSVYTGQKISLTFDDADIRRILQLIAEVSDLNIIAGDEVKGNISLRLVDVPWDQALDLIMDIKGLGMLREGNVVRVLPKEAIRAMRQSELTAIKEEREIEPVVTEVIKISYTDLKNVETPSNELLSERGKITMDARNKQLIVTDIPSIVSEIKGLVSVLDTPERQVLIEARIVEASSTFNTDLGINWGFSYDNSGTSTWGSPQTGDIGVGGNFIIPPFAPATAQAAGLGTAIQFGRVGIDTATLSLRLSALETSGHGKIISNPRVTTLNGERAKISQGTKIPYQTVSQDSINTELVEAALSLEVEPVINPDNSVILTVKASNSSPGTTVATGAGAAPSIDTKEAETKMLLKDGETTVIGGIFVEKDDYSENGVPFIMRIPFLGHLFKSTKKNSNRSELLIFITPHIIQ